MITMHKWDSESLYIGSVEANETGPMPERSTPTMPPELTGTQVARWTGIGWEKLAEAPVLEPAPSSDWPALIASRRYKAETGGIDVESMTVATDDRSQALITGAALQALIDPEYSLQWKTAAGFVQLTGQQILALASAVRAHVQACFDREAELLAALADGSITIDLLEQGWPA